MSSDAATPFNRRTFPAERYQNDAVFHALVDQLYMALRETLYTPTELREAVMLASTMYEAKHIRPPFINRRGEYEEQP